MKDIRLIDLLTLIFVVLKLVNVINWSWWWVLSPTWGSLVLWFVGVMVYIVCEERKRKKRVYGSKGRDKK